MIRRCNERDFEQVWGIVNDGAQAYKGIIPADCWHEPYMPLDELRQQILEGVVFWGFEEDSALKGVMGLQEVRDVTLIRHAYVRTASRSRGIGGKLLAHLQSMAGNPVLVGTWADAMWAIRFYERFGFRLVGPQDKDSLLRTYWSIPDRQVETSVVLADSKWRETHPASQAGA